jgi:hypothetical protein
MGLLDPLANGLWYAFGLGRKSKPFKHTDPEQFKASLGEFFIFNVSKIKPDFVQGGIQGAQQQQDDKLDDVGSFWQHTGAGFKRSDGSIFTIEAFGYGVDIGKIDDYMNDKFQLEAFSFPFDSHEISKLFPDAVSYIGKRYPTENLAFCLLPKDLEKIFVNRKEHYCSALWAIIMHKYGWSIVKKKIDPYLATPGDIHDGLYPQMTLKLSTFNIAGGV